MSSTNYNKTYGGRKFDVPTNRNHLRVILIFALIVLIAGGLIAVFASRASAKRKAADTPVAAGNAKTLSPSTETTSDPAAKKNVATADNKPIPVTSAPAAAVAKTPVPAVNPVNPATKTSTPAPAAPVTPAVSVASTASTSSDPLLGALLNRAENCFNSDQFGEARKLAEQALSSCRNQDQPEWVTAARLLGKTNIKIITSDYPFPDKKQRYEVMPGDALQKIAKKFNTTVEAVQRSNGLKSNDNSIWDGQTLIIYKGEWNIKVDKKRYRLLLFDGETLFRLYDISIGRQGRTPTGNFLVVSKISEPDWYSPQGKVPFGSKENVLGTRWLKLQGMDEGNRNLKGYGIHGTWERDSIGKDRSNGCIRMLNEDVEELYSIIPLKTPVLIAD